MKKQTVKEVDITLLKCHPNIPQIYNKVDISHLAEEIKTNGILQTPVVDANYQIIGGENVIEAAKSIGISNITVTVIDVKPEEAALFKVFSNLSRNKTNAEIYAELKILREHFGTRQGKKPSEIEKELGIDNCTLRKKLEKLTGINQTTIQRIEKLGKLNLIHYMDGDIVPKATLYNAIQDKKNDFDKYKPIEDISLQTVCCNACHQPTGRIVITKANKLDYKDNA